MPANDLGVTRVTDFLESRGHTVTRMNSDTSTAVLAAHALKVSVGAIVKSLLFLADGDPVLVLASGDRTVEVDRLRAILQVSQVRLARPHEVVELTGYRVGSVPPVAHQTVLPVLMDRHLRKFDTVFAAAGGQHAVFGTTPDNLEKLTGGTFEDLAV